MTQQNNLWINALVLLTFIVSLASFFYIASSIISVQVVSIFEPSGSIAGGVSESR